MKAGSCLKTAIVAASFITPFALSPMAATPAAASSGIDSRFVARAAPLRAVTLDVHLPLRNSAALDQLIAMQGNRSSPLFHHYLSVAQFRAAFGPTAATFARAAAALNAKGLTVTGRSTQSLRVEANVASVERAFGTPLGVMQKLGGSNRVAAMGPITLGPELAAIGAAITGLESVPQHHVHSLNVPLNRYAANGGYWFTDLKEAYTYPSFGTLNGKGATIGIVMSSDVLDSDTKAAFDHEHFSAISGKSVPTVVRHPVEGGAGVGGNAFAEASIDVQTSLGSAPGASEILYDIPDLSDESVIAAYTQVDEENAVDVVSSSFGGCELVYTRAYNHGQDFTGILRSEHEIFKQGNAQGITFLASSGDEAGLECPTVAYVVDSKPGRFIPSVSSPANDPNVTAVGGTNLETTTPPSPAPKGFLTSKYVSESEFGDPEIPYNIYGLKSGATVSGGYWGSGSGVSKLWGKPAYQRLVDTGASTRAVPDVSMQMGGCPGIAILADCDLNVESYGIYSIGGQLGGFIGTSLSSPEFAGLLALKVQESGRLGNVNPLLYELSAKNAVAKPFQFFHQNIPGYNGVVRVSAARKAYNPIVGVGTPNTRMLLGVPELPLALDPQTISNP